MLAAIRDRLTAMILVLLGGAEAASDDYALAFALLASAVLDCVLRRSASKHQVAAVARASCMTPGSAPDADMVEAMRRGGVSPEQVASALESGEYQKGAP